jgi:hypothetical protein
VAGEIATGAQIVRAALAAPEPGAPPALGERPSLRRSAPGVRNRAPQILPLDRHCLQPGKHSSKASRSGAHPRELYCACDPAAFFKLDQSQKLAKTRSKHRQR